MEWSGGKGRGEEDPPCFHGPARPCPVVSGSPIVPVLHLGSQSASQSVSQSPAAAAESGGWGEACAAGRDALTGWRADEGRGMRPLLVVGSISPAAAQAKCRAVGR